jgi:hypothetical protein
VSGPSKLGLASSLREHRAAVVPLAWAALLAVNTGVLIALGGDELPVLLLGGAAAGAAALAGVTALKGRAGRGAPDLSPPAALAAIAAAGLVLGAEFGTWLLLVSAGLLALALGGLLRERR